MTNSKSTLQEFNAKIPQLLREFAAKFTSPDDYPLYVVVKQDGTIAAETYKTALAVEMLIGNYRASEWMLRDADLYSDSDALSDDNLYKNYLWTLEELNRTELYESMVNYAAEWDERKKQWVKKP